jgi:calcineurin-like phosphoesterase family protein
MSLVYFNSDLHLGHKRVITFHDHYRAKAMGVSTIEEHDEKILDLWAQTIRRRDTIYILGDIGYNYRIIKGLPGNKKLLLGNHDTLSAKDYLEVFDDIIGPISYKRHWLAHFPPVESELFGKPVIHGHTHSTGISDPRYVNVCVEMNGGKPVLFEDIKTGKYTTWNRVNVPFESVDKG